MKLRAFADAKKPKDSAGQPADASSVRMNILICAGGGCIASGSLEVAKAIRQCLADRGLSETVTVVETGCLGPCVVGPVAAVYPDGVFYQNLKPTDAAEIVDSHVVGGRVVERLVSKTAAGLPVPSIHDNDFLKRQVKIVLRNCGVIDPLKIEEYIARDGYAALAKVLTEMKPDAVIDKVKRSGLRGRGGAGFSTGMKWDFTRKAKGDRKYILCNGDEGDPGAFMDRSVLEGDPHSV
ncbi:MAG: NADH-quinone oxidoreductase subunit F, partial [Planctomycetaceae bacterium]